MVPASRSCGVRNSYLEKKLCFLWSNSSKRSAKSGFYAGTAAQRSRLVLPQLELIQLRRLPSTRLVRLAQGNAADAHHL